MIPASTVLMCGAFESCQHGVQIAAGLGDRQAAQAVVAAELDDHHGGMQLQNARRPATASLVVAPLVPWLTTL